MESNNALSAAVAIAQEEPAASCQGSGNFYTFFGYAGPDYVPAQTFVALNTGRLTSVEVTLQDVLETGGVVVEIRAVDDASGAPTATVLASTTVLASEILNFQGAIVRVSFDPGAEVVAGKRYALALRAAEGGGFIWDGGSFTNPCADGQAYESNDGGLSFSSHDEDPNIDLFFSAFVTPPPPPDDEPDSNACTMEGNSKDNTLRGTSGRDVICGFGVLG